YPFPPSIISYPFSTPPLPLPLFIPQPLPLLIPHPAPPPPPAILFLLLLPHQNSAPNMPKTTTGTNTASATTSPPPNRFGAYTAASSHVLPASGAFVHSAATALVALVVVWGVGGGEVVEEERGEEGEREGEDVVGRWGVGVAVAVGSGDEGGMSMEEGVVVEDEGEGEDSSLGGIDGEVEGGSGSIWRALGWWDFEGWGLALRGYGLDVIAVM
ncbi:hypothetical protein CC80DRAFT_557821, partial [Byssothecium circinans]